MRESLFENRDVTQQDGCKTQDGRMTYKMSRKTGNAQPRATFFRHSAVLSATAVPLRKLPNAFLNPTGQARIEQQRSLATGVSIGNKLAITAFAFFVQGEVFSAGFIFVFFSSLAIIL